MNRVIRRLYQKWYPDKNPDNRNIATEVKKRKGRKINHFIDRTARRQKENSNQEIVDHRSSSMVWGGQSIAVPPFPKENLQPEKNAEDGRRWVKQAEVNYRSLVLLHSGSRNDPKLCADVCFMAHQVAEKALKGGNYFVCGLGGKALKSHNLTSHVHDLQAARPRETHGLVSHTAPLEVYYLDRRYPNRWQSPTIPADKYTSNQADEAKQHAEAILNHIKDIVE